MLNQAGYILKIAPKVRDTVFGTKAKLALKELPRLVYAVHLTRTFSFYQIKNVIV